MNLSTIEQGEELYERRGRSDFYAYECNQWLLNHASELLQIAREVESLRKENAHIKNFQYDVEGRIKLICPKCEEKRVY